MVYVDVVAIVATNVQFCDTHLKKPRGIGFKSIDELNYSLVLLYFQTTLSIKQHEDRTLANKLL